MVRRGTERCGGGMVTRVWAVKARPGVVTHGASGRREAVEARRVRVRPNWAWPGRVGMGGLGLEWYVEATQVAACLG
jgi:hypothetical protein